MSITPPTATERAVAGAVEDARRLLLTALAEAPPILLSPDDEVKLVAVFHWTAHWLELRLDFTPVLALDTAAESARADAGGAREEWARAKVGAHIKGWITQGAPDLTPVLVANLPFPALKAWPAARIWCEAERARGARAAEDK